MSELPFVNEGNALKVQRDQMRRLAKAGSEISSGLASVKALAEENSAELDALIAQAERMCKGHGIDASSASDADVSDIDNILAGIALEEGEKKSIANVKIEKIDQVDADGGWDSYLANINEYAQRNNVNLSGDPFESLLTPEERREIVQRIEDDYKLYGKAKCDKIDYTLAAVCGIICGFVDSFFVGMPGASKLGNVVDKVADRAVEKFARFTAWCDKKHIESLIEKKEISKWSEYQPTGMPLPKSIADPEEVRDKLFRENQKRAVKWSQEKIEELADARVQASSIAYLESRFRVPYDARYTKDLVGADGKVSLSADEHHLKSFAHSCDPVGLFFSILDQFTGKTTLIGNGKIQRFTPVKGKHPFRLQGTTFYTKILFGCINWFGHLMSDFVGSSGTRGHVGTRGAGIAAPFFEMFQMCNFGSFDVDGDKKTLADITSSMFTKGYDARFIAAQTIPVTLNEGLVRLCWSIKRHYYHNMPWSECKPIHLSSKPELRRMLLVGHGCLCLVDAADAAIRSWGNMMNFLLHINIVAWSRFAILGYHEIRAWYNKDALNVEEMEKDLNAEWQSLQGESLRLAYKTAELSSD